MLAWLKCRGTRGTRWCPAGALAGDTVVQRAGAAGGVLALGALARPSARRSGRQRCSNVYGWLADLAEDPVARASLQAWDALRLSLTGQSALHTPRSRQRLAGGALLRPARRGARRGRLRSPTAGVANLDAAGSGFGGAACARRRFAGSTDAATADAVLAEAVRSLRRARHLNRDLLARMRGDRAVWALRQKRFDEAQALHRRAQRSFRVLGRIDEALNAMAGEARASSRAGQYDAAVALFEQALGEAGAGAIRFNLMLGLGAAHLLQGTERSIRSTWR